MMYRGYVIIVTCIYLSACNHSASPVSTTQLNPSSYPVQMQKNVIKTGDTPSKQTTLVHKHSHQDPFASYSASNTNTNKRELEPSLNPLSQYSLNELTMVGTITQDDQLSALIATPKGLVYRIVMGDKLGVEQDSVIAISQTKLTLSQLSSNSNVAASLRELRLAPAN